MKDILPQTNVHRRKTPAFFILASTMMMNVSLRLAVNRVRSRPRTIYLYLPKHILRVFSKKKTRKRKKGGKTEMTGDRSARNDWNRRKI